MALPGHCCSGKHPEDDVLSVTSITSKVVVTSDDDRAQTRSIIFMVAMSLDCIFEGELFSVRTETDMSGHTHSPPHTHARTHECVCARVCANCFL